MVGTTSSAVPHELFRYADVCDCIQQELSGEAGQLAGALGHFAGTCTEYHVPVDHLPGDLRSATVQAAEVDRWVKQVGDAFLRADGIGLAWWPWGAGLPFSGTVLLGTLFGAFAGRQLLGGVPAWLQSALQRMLAFPGSLNAARLMPNWRPVFDFIDDLASPFAMVAGRKATSGSFLRIMQQFGRLLNGAMGTRGYITKFDSLGKLLLGSSKAISGLGNVLALRDFQQFFSGKLTNAEILRAVIKAWVPFIGDKIADGVMPYLVNPGGHWRGLAPPVGEAESAPVGGVQERPKTKQALDPTVRAEVEAQQRAKVDALLEPLKQKYNGETYPPEWKTRHPGGNVEPPLVRDGNGADPDMYVAILEQFDVEESARYKAYIHDPPGTYCNVYVSDATRAMGVEIPHRVAAEGAGTAVWSGGHEQTANDMVEWLATYGEKEHWTRVDASTAQNMANEGKPTVAVWKNPLDNPKEGTSGHVAMVRPTFDEYQEEFGPHIAQAGGTNMNAVDSTVSQRFNSGWETEVVYYYHE
jgi:hypothetical protein